MMSWLPFSFIDFSIFPDTPTGVHKLIWGIFLITLIAFWCNINIIGSLIVLHIVHNTKWENKYPKIKWLINYFKTVNTIYLTMDVIALLVLYISVLGVCIRLLYFDL
jgi:hypothetical protein